LPDFTLPTRPWIALLLGALNTGLAFIVGAKTADSGLSPFVVFYLACSLAVLGWVLLHIVPTNGAPGANAGSPSGPVGPAEAGTTPVASVSSAAPVLPPSPLPSPPPSAPVA